MIPKIVDLAQRIQSLLQWKSVFILLLLAANDSYGREALDLPQKWKVEKVQKGVRIFSADSPSGYQWVKAQVETTGTIAKFLALLDDVQRAEMWIANVKQVKILERPTPNQRLVHTTFNAPWPVKDRDMVTFSEIKEIAPNEVIIKIFDGTSTIPVDPVFVRIEQVKGQWHLLELDTNRIEISYVGYGEPSGNLPVWLANNLVMSSTLETFSNLQRLMRIDDN